MKRVLVGHRGVGKSSLLARHQVYFPQTPTYDLDQEIEKKYFKTVTEIFNTEGEAKFREYEVAVFNELIQQTYFTIALGGGFPVDQIPSSIEVVFVSRVTDEGGRIFLNRPQINDGLSALEDSLILYKKRQPLFISRADMIYHMPEGIDQPDQIEKKILSNEPLTTAFYLTAVKNNSFEQRFNKIEKRTDLQFSDVMPEDLVSYRKSTKNKMGTNCSDWALELGPPPFDVDIVSIHEGSIQQGIEQLSIYATKKLKLCPILDSWSDLILGYHWQRQDPQRRSFLPRGEGYSWFRLIMSPQQQINFVRGFTDMKDQPTLYEVLDFELKNKSEFGAVLGSPVVHSRTPWEQGSKLSYAVLPITIDENDYDIALPFLAKLGLKFAAVTSPLKNKAHGNSILFKNNEWLSTSTDQAGFKKLFNLVPVEFQKSVAVWGGRGVIESLRKEIPDLKHYAARTGGGDPVDTLIWAAPRHKDVKFPLWKPKIVVDLNYVENSMGLEYAKIHGIPYISGLAMFIEQAYHQREFWKEHL